MKRAGLILLAASILAIVLLTLPRAGAVGQPYERTTGQSTSWSSNELRISWPTVPECGRYYPRVAYNWKRKEYLVVWYNWWSANFQDIYAQRVTLDGRLKSHFTAATGANGDGKARQHPALAYNSQEEEYLLVYMLDALGDGIHWEVWGRRVAWNGSWLGPEFQIMSWPNRAFWQPRVAWNDWLNEYLVVASAFDTQSGKWNDVAGRPVLADGRMPTPTRAISAQDQAQQPHQVDIAYNSYADEYLVVWSRSWAGNDWDIAGARVIGSGGQVVNPPGTILLDGSDHTQGMPVVISNNLDRYMVLWQENTSSVSLDWEIWGREFDLAGNAIGSRFDVFGGEVQTIEEYPAAAWGTNDNIYTVRREMDNFSNQYRVVGVDGWHSQYSSGPLWQPRVIAENSSWTPPAVAAGGPGSLVVYGRQVGNAIHLYGRIYARGVAYMPFVQ